MGMVWEAYGKGVPLLGVCGEIPKKPWELTYPIKNGILKMIFLFPRWDMLIPWRVSQNHVEFPWIVGSSAHSMD